MNVLSMMKLVICVSSFLFMQALFSSEAVAAKKQNSKLMVSSQKIDQTTSHSQTNAKGKVIEIEVGHSHVLKISSARQVAVGNSQILQANAASASEVILFGKKVGSTTVDVWDQKGRYHSFQVEVHAAGKKQTLAEIKTLLAGVDGIKVQTAGGHIVLQANSLTSVERQIVNRILERYPSVVDLTSSMNWDPMVMLDVLVVELPTYKLNEMGVRWEAADGSGGLAGLSWQVGRSRQGILDSSGQALDNSHTPSAWVGVNAALTSQLHAMAQRGEAVLLAQPQLVTRNGKAATFLAGGEVPYAVTDSKGRTHTEFKKYGVSLNVTPELGLEGRITASVEVEVSAVDPTIVTAAGPAMRMRKASTQFNAYSGQTMVIAGFMSSEHSKSYQGAPSEEGGIFERLAGVQDERLRQTELAILVTPVVMEAHHPRMRERARKAQAFAQTQTSGKSRLTVPALSEDPVQASQWVGDIRDLIPSSLTADQESLVEMPKKEVNQDADLYRHEEGFYATSNAWELYQMQSQTQGARTQAAHVNAHRSETVTDALDTNP